jgi:hypothetical protein
MQRLFALVLTLATLASAQSYNEHILKIEANIIPRIILMDYKFEEKMVEGSLAIIIVHTPTDLAAAQKIQKLLEEKYPEGIKNFPLTIRLVPYKQMLESAPKATLYYLMNNDAESIKAVIGRSRKNNILTFSHDAINLRYGAHVSLRIDKKIVPYINPASLRQSDISLRPALLSISELYQ